MSTLHVLHTPCEVVREEDAGKKWCFGCRKRLPHTAKLWATVERSYYDPHWAVECSRCGKDRTLFPGRVYL